MSSNFGISWVPLASDNRRKARISHPFLYKNCYPNGFIKALRTEKIAIKYFVFIYMNVTMDVNCQIVKYFHSLSFRVLRGFGQGRVWAQGLQWLMYLLYLSSRSLQNSSARFKNRGSVLSITTHVLGRTQEKEREYGRYRPAVHGRCTVKQTLWRNVAIA